MNKTDIYTKLISENFWEDISIQIQLAGIENGKQLYSASCRGEVEAFLELGLISNIGEDGLMFGYTSEQLQSEEFISALQQAPKYLLEIATEEELTVMQSNVLKLSEVVKADWYSKFLQDTPIYFIHILVVRPEMRGKGILRSLLEPLFKQCAEKKRTIVLQTLSRNSAFIYEHFGFEIVETVCSDELGICCYNMMKKF